MPKFSVQLDGRNEAALGDKGNVFKRPHKIPTITGIFT